MSLTAEISHLKSLTHQTLFCHQARVPHHTPAHHGQVEWAHLVRRRLLPEVRHGGLLDEGVPTEAAALVQSADDSHLGTYLLTKCTHFYQNLYYNLTFEIKM